MAVTPTGNLSLVQYRMRTMLADCTAFQTWCGADDATEALGFVVIERLLLDDEPHDLEGVRAFVENGRYSHRRIGPVREFEVAVKLEAVIDAATHTTVTDQNYYFHNNLDAVLEELMGMASNASQSNNHLAIEEYEVQTGRFDPAENNGVVAYGADLMFRVRG